MNTATITLLALGIGAVLAVVFAPGRNAALGAWSLVSFRGRRRRSRQEMTAERPSKG